MHSGLQQLENFDPNKLNMWRCVVAMAHADGVMHDEEKKYLLTIFKNMQKRAGLTDEDYNILVNDIDNPQDILEILADIKDPKYRAQVIYFARLLAYKDGEFAPSEKLLLEKMQLNAAQGQDLEKLKAQINQDIGNEMAAHETTMDAERPDNIGLFWMLDRLALVFGFDLMDE